MEPGDSLTVEGYYMGIADEGLNSDKEILIKDVNTDDIIAVRSDADAANKNYDVYNSWVSEHAIGEMISVTCTLEVDGSDSTPNKLYLCATAVNKLADAVDVSYQPYNTVEVSSWEEMQKLFQVGAIQEYTYIKFTGDMFFSMYTSTTDPVYSYRLHMNSDAGALADIKPDGTRSVSIRNNVLKQNLGSDVIADIIDEAAAKGKYPGEKVNGTLIALYTGANGSYFQLTILDEAWVDLTVVE